MKNDLDTVNNADKIDLPVEEKSPSGIQARSMNKMKLFDTTTHPAMLALHDFGSKDFERFYKRIKFIEYYEGGKSVL